MIEPEITPTRSKLTEKSISAANAGPKKAEAMPP